MKNQLIYIIVLLFCFLPIKTYFDKQETISPQTIFTKQVEVKRIEILVHPEYVLHRNAQNLPLDQFHPKQKELISSWNKRVDMLKDDPHVIFFYYSYFTKETIDKAMRDDTLINSVSLKREIERIREYKKKMGKRFFVFDGYFPAKANFSEIENKVKEAGFYYIPKHLEIFSYGEMLDVCAKAWGAELQKLIGVPKENFNQNKYIDLRKQLSLTIEESNILKKHWFELLIKIAA